MQNIDQEQFKALSESGEYTIIDVRTPSECATGIIPNATNINIMDQAGFNDEIKKLDKSKKYLIYCRSGNRSGQACDMLDAMGFLDTNNLIGGMMFWSGPVR